MAPFMDYLFHDVFHPMFLKTCSIFQKNSDTPLKTDSSRDYQLLIILLDHTKNIYNNPNLKHYPRVYYDIPFQKNHYRFLDFYPNSIEKYYSIDEKDKVCKLIKHNLDNWVDVKTCEFHQDNNFPRFTIGYEKQS